MQLQSLLSRIPWGQLKELDNLLITAAAVLGLIGLFVDPTIQRLAPLVTVLGLLIYTAHLIYQRRLAADLARKPAGDKHS